MSKDNKSKSNNFSSKKQKKNLGIMIGTILVLLLTIVSFILVPALSQSGSSGGKLIFGKYGNSIIEYVPGNYFARQIEYVNNIYRDNEALSNNLDYKRNLVWQSAFNQAVIQKVMEENILKSGLVISDSQIDKVMVERGPFQEDGKFSEELYKNTSNSVKFDLRKRFREDLLRDHYVSDVMYGAKRSDGFTNFMSNLSDSEKSFQYAIFSTDNMDNSFYKTYGSANIQKFTKGSFNRITIFENEEAAQSILTKIRAEEMTFKEAAIAESKDSFASEGGNAGDIYFYELEEDLETIADVNKIFSLSANQVSEVIKTSYGWVIYQMINSPQIADVSTKETINDIKVYMSRNEKGLIEDHLISLGIDFKGNLKNETDFKTNAQKINAETGETDYFPVNYGNNKLIEKTIANATGQNPVFSGAPFDEVFLQGLFSLNTKGEVSEPLVLGNNIIVAQLLGSRDVENVQDVNDAYKKYQMESEIASYMQSDLQNMVLESENFENNFTEAFNKLFTAN